jgi:hypothetical protein
MPSLFRAPRPRVLMASVLLTMFMQALSMSARAEIQITGGSDAIKVEAKEVSLEVLLIALNKAFGLQYRSSANLSRSVSGTFTGSLQQVVSRVLLVEGYNFVSETSARAPWSRCTARAPRLEATPTRSPRPLPCQDIPRPSPNPHSAPLGAGWRTVRL